MCQLNSITQQNAIFQPILDIYVVWHPRDREGGDIAEKFIEYFRGTPFTGLISGAVEVFVRSEGWLSGDDCPRPIPSVCEPLPNGLQKAKFTAIVPILGMEMAKAVRDENNPWHRYVENIVRLEKSQKTWVLPFCLDSRSIKKTTLGKLLGRYQYINTSSSEEAEDWCRNLVQGITQFLSDKERLTVFISYAKSETSEEDNKKLTKTVRQIIADTHLQSFCDTKDLQFGRYWDSQLRIRAAESALLALRTDLYSSREWCQREVSVSKRAGMPIVIVDALKSGEERGSFLMDHVPRIPVRMGKNGWNKIDLCRALNVLVGEHLKRILWSHQRELLEAQFEIDWWSPHAPEPLTFVQWLVQKKNAEKGFPRDGTTIRILHPEPPLGPEEQEALVQTMAISDVTCELDIITPRSLIIDFE